MSFVCLDCGYRGNKFRSGACPACGSFRVERIQPQPLKQHQARKPYRILLCLALWIWLIQAVWERLQ